MTVRQAVAERRSIRQYDTSHPVEEGDLLAVLEAARLAASGCNAQPWRFIVIRDPEVKARLAAEAMALKQNQAICRQAPVMIVCLAVADAHCDIPERIVELSQADPTAAEPTIAKRTGRLMRSRFDSMPASERAAYMALNTTIAITQMMLQATELGYGTCWLKAYDDAAARKILDIPEGVEIVAFTPLGRPAEAPRQRPRLAMSEIAFSNRYGEPLVR